MRVFHKFTPVKSNLIPNNINLFFAASPSEPVPGHLAKGESFWSLTFQYRVSHSWINAIIKEVAEAIIKRMFELTIMSPTKNQLRQNISQFFSKWNFPNCAPKRSGSLYFNCKEYYLIVLLAVVDADCKFTAVDIGSYGREGDAGIYLKSQIGKIIKNNAFNIPAPKVLPGTNNVVPHVIVGDEAFALHENLMKPYSRQQSVHDQSKAVYNYRLSRARRTTENTFGILCDYFKLFFLPIATAPEITDKLIKLLTPGQKHFDDVLPLPTENLIPRIQCACQNKSH
ncbi:hypothetical protein AGLY_006776 [Aphis glycines]|uniref:DDE Tnp4 domain-containing protein n=1 Tax=Aphis glycines TaxID=307491 RepID=A0A6G0TQE6_APHGL|nr:hypothetical protein AGLY_006776 [Aphis glycines]